MLALRSHILAKVSGLFTAAIFVNMGFFLAEVRMLGLDRGNTELVENIAKLIAGSGAEEERDGPADAREDGGNKLDIVHHPPVPADHQSFIASSRKYGADSTLNISPGHAATCSPPPEA